QTQIILSGQSMGVRYQYLPEGSYMLLMPTDHGSLIPNPPVSKTALPGTQGTLLSLEGLSNGTWYRIEILGPNGESLGLLQNFNVDDHGQGGYTLTDPYQSQTVQTTLPLTDTAPMYWTGYVDSQTLGNYMINRLNVFDRGPGVVTILSPSADIARVITGGRY